ncbi:MAG: DegT/DnrJ/EryC1/StrS family aminotransferase [Alphaproteobacteria bacterium]
MVARPDIVVGDARVSARRDIPYVDFPAQYAAERDDIHQVVAEVFGAGDFVGGPAVMRLELAVSEYLGVDHVVALNSGTDALAMALRGLGIGWGDEVITPPNSFVASTAAIVQVGATPVFADVLDDQNIDPVKVEAAITERTRAIMPVHLTGRIAAMDELMALAETHGLKVVEDAAQAFGSRLNDRPAGTIGHVGCFSTHPLKNLNAAGDGGLLVTDDGDVADQARLWRNHGMRDRNTVVEWGSVSRMDGLQAALLTMRLGKLAGVIEQRRALAQRYRDKLDPAHVFIPEDGNGNVATYHTFVVQVDRRDELQSHLAANGIGSAIHYPVPIHLQPAAAELGCGAGDYPVTERQAGRILSLPIHQFLDQADVDHVCDTIHRFFAGGPIAG